jgi:allophanate hydrolase
VPVACNRTPRAVFFWYTLGRVKTADRSFPFDVVSLRRAYDEGETTPSQVIERTLERIEADATEGIWIHLRDSDDLRAEAIALEKGGNGDLALYGVPFAVKDNIDVAGVPTTVACPDYAYLPSVSAPVVDRLRAQGALFVGKTNLDQFATGLVGVRSPYGTPPNPFDPRYVTGGSSSGSAAAVARGHVPFAVATDTAGSGRIPATFNNLVGFKPSRGLLSTRGVVPACRSRDCVSILALTCPDAREVARVAAAFDADDPYSSREADRFLWGASPATASTRLAIPSEGDLAFTKDAQRLEFDRACARLAAMGHTLVPVEMAPFFEAGALLYEGPWIAERLSGLQAFLRDHSSAVLPVIRTILSRGEAPTGADAFRALHRLATLKRAIEPLWDEVTALVVPGAPEFPRIEEVRADPLTTNARLGRYTTFGNLLDLVAVAVPSGFRPDGLPAGIALLGPWGRDATLLALATEFHQRSAVALGALPASLPPPAPSPATLPATHIALAVVGAHLAGQPLNHQLTDRGGVLVRTTGTSPRYRLYALPNTQPAKPGLVRVESGAGAGIEVEVWALPLDTVGSLLAGVRAPLCLGTIELIDGSSVHGFLCEACAVSGARDISTYGGWRAFLAQR